MVIVIKVETSEEISEIVDQDGSGYGIETLVEAGAEGFNYAVQMSIQMVLQFYITSKIQFKFAGHLLENNWPGN